MSGLMLSPLGRALAGLAAVAALAAGLYLKGRADEREALLSRLASDRITILKDGAKIDHEVLTADDDALCALLGALGCGVPDGAGGD